MAENTYFADTVADEADFHRLQELEPSGIRNPISNIRAQVRPREPNSTIIVVISDE